MDVSKPITELAAEVVRDGEAVANAPQVIEKRTLGDWSLELRYFTTALICTHGKFDRDPLYEFNSRHYVEDPDLRPFAIDCPRPFFQGLGTHTLGRRPRVPTDPPQEQVNWDHRLYAVHASRWEELLTFIGGITFTDPQIACYVKVFNHTLEIMDATAWSQLVGLDALPTIQVTVFGVSSNTNFVYMRPAVDPPRTRAYPVVEPPRNDAIIEADAVLGPPPDPQAAFRSR